MRFAAPQQLSHAKNSIDPTHRKGPVGSSRAQQPDVQHVSQTKSGGSLVFNLYGKDVGNTRSWICCDDVSVRYHWYHRQHYGLYAMYAGRLASSEVRVYHKWEVPLHHENEQPQQNLDEIVSEQRL